MHSKKDKWSEIKPDNSWFNLQFTELFRYKDLITLFIKRDFVTFYKQTILGPLWYIIQPLVNTIVFTIIFGQVAKISTDGLPPFIFYMLGTTVWGFFATCVNTTSNTFVTNSQIFGKVYFPRLTVPIANVVISLVQFAIQFSIFLSFLIYFIIRGLEINFSYYILIAPLLLLQMCMLGLGIGILISSLTTKYRDLTFVMSFAVQLWMFATPVVYPLSIVPEKYRILAAMNPMTAVVEGFRGIFLGSSSIELIHIIISILITIIILFTGIILFKRIEKNFMDTV